MDCPTGILVDVSTTPDKPEGDRRNSFEDFLKSLGVGYVVSNGEYSVKPISWISNSNAPRPCSPSLSEDDLLSNEVFDFSYPFEQLDVPQEELRKFPCSSNSSSQQRSSQSATSESLTWNPEVFDEARRISKRLSIVPVNCDLDMTKGTTSSDLSSVDIEHGTSTLNLGSSGDDSVFSSPSSNKDSMRKQVSANKENMPRPTNRHLTFEVHPNSEAALTPEGVRCISGPGRRRGTFVLNRSTATPKTGNRLSTPGSIGIRNSSVARVNQDTRQQAKPLVSTPKMVPRSKSFVKTPQANPRIPTFRKGESPQRAQGRRSISLGRNMEKDTLESRTCNNVSLLKPQNTGSSPLLRKALVPKLASRPHPTTSVTAGVSKGPMRAAPLAMRKDNQNTFGSTLDARRGQLMFRKPAKQPYPV